MNSICKTATRSDPRRTLLLSALAGLAGLVVPPSAKAATVAAEPTREWQADSFAALRAQHAGHRWVLHLWGETCGPCLAELPQWPALVQAMGVPLVLIQADASSGRAQPQLAASGLNRYPRWATRQGLDEYARARIDPGWAGELPRTLLIAADGSTTAFSGRIDKALLGRWAAQTAASAQTPRPR